MATRRRYQVKQTDGGRRESGFLNETRDCTVRALALAGNMTYAEAHEFMRLGGRKERKGANPEFGLAHAKRANKLTWSVTPDLPAPRIIRRYSRYYGFTQKAQKPTLRQVMAALPKQGRYYLCTRRHAFAVIDGMIHDSGEIVGPASRIESCWTIIPAPKTKPEPVIDQTAINAMWARLDALEAKLI